MLFMIKTVSNTTPVRHAIATGIKTSLSPFSLRENEQSVPVIVKRRNEKFTTPAEAEFLISVGKITEEEIKILEIINRFTIITINQLHTALSLKGVNIDRTKLISSIKKLIKYRFAQAVRFENGQNTPSGYIIALENNGVSFLKARHSDDDGVHVRFVSYFKSIEVSKLKKNLSANQLVINLFEKNGVELPDLCRSPFLTDLQRIDRKNVVRPEFSFTFDGNSCLVECVKRNEMWETKLADKLGYYFEILSLPEDRLSIKTKNPVLILIAEDEHHCEEVLRIAAEAKYKNIVATCDPFTYNLTPDNAFFKPEETKKNLFSKLKSLLKSR